MAKLLVLANEATAAQRRVYFHLVDATDGITAETGEAGGQPQVSSDGGAWTNTGIGTLTAIGNGRYYADLTQTLVQTAGTQIETRYKSANTAECPGDSVQVVAFDPNDATRLGLTALPDAPPFAAGGLAGDDDIQTLLGRIIGTLAAGTHQPQGGDAHAIVNNGTHGNAALNTDLDSLLTRLTAARGGYLDNLNVGGNVASSAEVTSVQNNTRVVRVVPAIIERPDSGTTTYRIELFLYDSAGNMEAPDSTPTIELVDNAGNDHSLMLDNTTMTQIAVGHFRAILTVSFLDALEQLIFTFSVTEGGELRKYGNTSIIVDTTAVDFTAADRTKLEAVHAKLPSRAYLTSTDNSDGSIDDDDKAGYALSLAGVNAVTTGLATSATQTTILNRIGAFTGTGVNTILGFFKALLSRQASTPSDVGGSFDAATDSTEAIRELIEATKIIDTTVTPWALVYFRKGTGGLGVGVELLRQPITQVDGSNVTATTHIPGRIIA